MTIANHIIEETMEFATFNFVRNLSKEGYDASFIAKMTELCVKKVQEIIQKN